MEDKTEDDTNDEILAELRRKQHELKVISQHNQTVGKKLLKLAKEAMHRQDVRKKMAAADAEVPLPFVLLTFIQLLIIYLNFFNFYYNY